MAVTGTVPWCVDKAGTGLTKQTFTSPSRTVDAEPNTATILPLYAGEMVLDTTNNTIWKSLTAAGNSWVALTTPVPA